jgi:hypothetical protein
MMRRILLTATIGLLCLLVVVIPRFAGAQQEQICFITVPGVTNCVQGRFAQFWRENGNLEVFGFPVSGELVETVDGVPRTVQYFERARFEYHPENAAPFDVLLGRLGALRLEQQGRPWFGLPKIGGTGPDCLLSDITGQAVCGEFLAYFRARGIEFDGVPGTSIDESVALFGLPLSAPSMELNSNGVPVLTQWFERARFELQPENPPGFRVLLGLVGSETYLAALPAAPATTSTLPPTLTPRPTDDDDDDDDEFISRQGTISNLNATSNRFTLNAERAFNIEYGRYTNFVHQDGSAASERNLDNGSTVFVRGATRRNYTIRASTIIIGGRGTPTEPTSAPPTSAPPTDAPPTDAPPTTGPYPAQEETVAPAQEETVAPNEVPSTIPEAPDEAPSAEAAPLAEVAPPAEESF